MLGGPICPEYSQKLFDTFSLSLTEDFAQNIEDGAIADLDLAVALWVV